MPLTVRGDGTGAAFQVNSTWWNEYHDLLTGAMTDQPVSLYYAPGAVGSTPVLSLKSNNNADLLQGRDGTGTQVMQVTRTGALITSDTITAPQFYFNRALGGANKEAIRFHPTDMSQDWGIYYRTDGSLAFYEAISNKTTLALKDTGDIIVSNNITLSGGTITGPNGGVIQLGVNAAGDIHLNPGTGWTYFSGTTAYVNSSGNFHNPNGYGIVLGNDNNTGSKVVRIFIGTTDPSTYTTVNDGDIWIKG